MSIVIQTRSIVLNGGQPSSYDVAVDVNGDVYYPVGVLLALGADVVPGETISVDKLPTLALTSTSAGKAQVVRVPGSPLYDTGDRVQNITDTDPKGNQLDLTATVVNGALTDLSGSVRFSSHGITANISVAFKDGHIVPTGSVTVSTGNLKISVSRDPDGLVQGSVGYDGANFKLSLTYNTTTNKPPTWTLALSYSF